MERLVPVFHLQGLSLTVLETAFRSINRKPPGFLSDMKKKRYMGWALVWLLHIGFVSNFTSPLRVLTSFRSGF